MRLHYIIIGLLFISLVSTVSATNKLSPSEINWSQNMSSNMSMGGYLNSGKLDTNQVFKVFTFTVPWIGISEFVALRADGGAIAVSTNGTYIMNYAITNGYRTEIYNNITLPTTLKITKSYTEIVGIGSNAILCGTGGATPIVQVGDSTHQVFSIHFAGFAIKRPGLDSVAPTAGTIGLYMCNVSAYNTITNVIERVYVYHSETDVKLGNNTVSQEVIDCNWISCQFGNFAGKDKYCVYQSKAIDQKFIGCSFRGYCNTGSIGFYADGYNMNDAFLSNCYLGSASYDAYTIDSDFCLKWVTGAVLRVEQCQFENGHVADIGIYDGLAVGIIGCNIGGSGRAGLGIYVNTATRDLYHLRIANNDIGCTSAGCLANHAIQIEKGGSSYRTINPVISDNTITSQYSGIFLWETYGPSITGNTIRIDGGTSGYGIRLGSSGAYSYLSTVVSNVIDLTGATSATGIAIEANCNYNYVVGNCIRKNGMTGITNSGANNQVTLNIDV